MFGEVAGVLVMVPLKFRHSGAGFNRPFPDALFIPAVFGADHLGVQLEQLFQPLGVVAEAPADVDALQRLVVALVRFAQVGGHFVWIVKVGDRRREVRFARQQDVFGAAG